MVLETVLIYRFNVIPMKLPTAFFRTFLIVQLVKNPPAMWETWVRSLGWEDPLKKRKANLPNSSILAWRIPWAVWGRKELDMTETLSLHFFRTRTKNFKSVWKHKRPQIATALLWGEKKKSNKDRSRRIRFLDFRLYYKATKQ